METAREPLRPDCSRLSRRFKSFKTCAIIRASPWSGWYGCNVLISGQYHSVGESDSEDSWTETERDLLMIPAYSAFQISAHAALLQPESRRQSRCLSPAACLQHLSIISPSPSLSESAKASRRSRSSVSHPKYSIWYLYHVALSLFLHRPLSSVPGPSLDPYPFGAVSLSPFCLSLSLPLSCLLPLVLSFLPTLSFLLLSHFQHSNSPSAFRLPPCLTALRLTAPVRVPDRLSVSWSEDVTVACASGILSSTRQ